ncbi:MAG: MerR family transcriptional regulator [Prolixibacteraceae bacterium]
MPYKRPQIEKVFYTIGEVAEMFSVNTSLIRFWEREFEMLKPQKNKKGNRLFTKDDIEQVKLIYHLVKERGMTIHGARQKLKDNKEETVQNHELVERLLLIRKMLTDLKDEMK